MSKSNTEEIIGCLWCIIWILAFVVGWKFLMYLAAINAIISFIGSIYYAFKEI